MNWYEIGSDLTLMVCFVLLIIDIIRFIMLKAPEFITDSKSKEEVYPLICTQRMIDLFFNSADAGDYIIWIFLFLIVSAIITFAWPVAIPIIILYTTLHLLRWWYRIKTKIDKLDKEWYE